MDGIKSYLKISILYKFKIARPALSPPAILKPNFWYQKIYCKSTKFGVLFNLADLA